MGSAALSRRVEKVVAYAPLSEMSDVFSAGLKALCAGADGIMVKSVGEAARDAGEQLLEEWGERSCGR